MQVSSIGIANALAANLDGDGATETVWLEKSSAGAGFREVTVGNADGKEVYRSRPAKIWKLLLADVDGDGRPEVALGLVGAKKGRAGEANGLHIFRWDGASLVALWRGSSLSMPFRDVAFFDWDSDGVTELLSLEINPTNRLPYVAIYHWTGFGFEGEYLAAFPKDTRRILLSMLDKHVYWNTLGSFLPCGCNPSKPAFAEDGISKSGIITMNCKPVEAEPRSPTVILDIETSQQIKGADSQ